MRCSGKNRTRAHRNASETKLRARRRAREGHALGGAHDQGVVVAQLWHERHLARRSGQRRVVLQAKAVGPLDLAGTDPPRGIGPARLAGRQDPAFYRRFCKHARKESNPQPADLEPATIAADRSTLASRRLDQSARRCRKEFRHAERNRA
jgi:hypothetical protein